MTRKITVRHWSIFLVVLQQHLVYQRSFVTAQANFNTTENFRAELYSNIVSPRGMLLDDAGDILVVSQRGSSIVAVFSDNGTVRTAQIVDNATPGLNHGIAFSDGLLYASSITTVYRWPYTPGQRTLITANPEVVIKNIPTGGHYTRTLKFSRSKLLYVSVGSDTNVDNDSTQAKLRRFNISSIPSDGIEYNTGFVVADGVRNEVGLAFDADDVLWGVDHGAGNLSRDDLGGDIIHHTNPADELIKHEDQHYGKFYCYPFCWTVDELNGHAQGSQLTWPDFMSDGIHSDDWCGNVSNVQVPTLPLPAHHAAIGMTFYDGSVCNTSTGAFPCSMTGDAFVAFRGSATKIPPAGYKVARLPIDPDTRLPTGEILDIMFEPNPVGCGSSGVGCFRPVDLVFNSQGHLIVGADASSELFRIWHEESD